MGRGHHTRLGIPSSPRFAQEKSDRIMTGPRNDAHEHFDREISKLGQLRPAIEPLEHDGLKRRSSAWKHFARLRVAVVAATVGGVLMSTPATALGISGLASSGSASTAQYGSAGTSNPAPKSGVKPLSVTKPSSTEAVTPEEQVAQTGPGTAGALPFTGFVLMPLLFIGLAFLIVGLLARFRAGPNDAAPS